MSITQRGLRMRIGRTTNLSCAGSYRLPLPVMVVGHFSFVEYRYCLITTEKLNPEFMKWTFSSLKLDMLIVANRSVSQKS